MTGTTPTRKHTSIVFGTTIIAGAMLVFQIQPVVGKLLLPSLGGGASTWTACMLFFQLMLLAGYSYAHFLVRIRRARSQAVVHWTILGASLFFLPVTVDTEDLHGLSPDPSLAIVTILVVSVGLPFLTVSSTAPLMQRWSAMTHPLHSPYRFYALSNVGALLILISYPLFIEPNLSLETQRNVWSAAYALFVVISAVAGVLVWKNVQTGNEDATYGVGKPTDGEDPDSRKYPTGRAALALVFSATGVVVLLAFTNQITRNIAPIPFLWVLPLTVYLFSFVICFSSERTYDRSVWGAVLAVASGVTILLHFFANFFEIAWVVASYVAVLFCVCMVCHGELFRLRPGSSSLTTYYLLIAVGGVIGGAFVSLIAPLLFDKFWESLLGVYVAYMMFGYAVVRARRDTRLSSARSSADAKEIIRGQKSQTRSKLMFGVPWFVGGLALPVVALFLGTTMGQFDVFSTRNFYGLLSVTDIVVDGTPRRNLVDGTTIHGYQITTDPFRKTPTSYFRENTGIALVLTQLASVHEQLDVGIVGLGAGTLAAYGREGDRYRYYELNPAVEKIAHQYFSFIEDSAAEIDIVVGDARVSMEKELEIDGGREYDVLVIDAFTSDAIPVHLLTREAFSVYWSHLKPDGVLAFHISNNYFDLSKVVASLGRVFGKRAVLVRTEAEAGRRTSAEWVIVTDSLELLSDIESSGMANPIRASTQIQNVWTDDYSNLIRTLKSWR